MISSDTDTNKLIEVDDEQNNVRDLLKIVFMGDSGVGKTNIMSRFNSDTFSSNSKPTIGMDFATKTVQIKNRIVRLQLWDTAGQERYLTFTSAYFKDAHGVILVYDVTNRTSFNNIGQWLKSCREHTDRDKTSVILIGNKIDLDATREVSEMEGRDYAEQHGIIFMETSALDNRGGCIDTAFYLLVSDVIPKYDIPEADVPSHIKRVSGVPLDDALVKGTPREKKGCC